MSVTGYAAIAAIVLALTVFSLCRFNYCTPRDVPWLRDTPIAHRGLHNAKLDEDSLGAFANAVSNGYAIELDIRATRDGIPVVIHDNSLNRLTGVSGSVSEMTVAELGKLRFLKSGERIPTLSEALSLIGGRVPVLIDVKDFGIPGRIENEALRALDGYAGQWAFQSFNPLACRWLKKHSADVSVGLLLADIPALHWGCFRNLKDNLLSAICFPDFISYSYCDMNSIMAAAYRANNVTVLGWGVSKSLLDSRIYLQYVDNVVFDVEEQHP